MSWFKFLTLTNTDQLTFEEDDSSITRTTGSWIADGVELVGNTILIVNNTEFNNGRFKIIGSTDSGVNHLILELETPIIDEVLTESVTTVFKDPSTTNLDIYKDTTGIFNKLEVT